MGYRGKVVEQERARELRKVGWTLAEICAELSVSKSSVSVWCRGVEIDQEELARRRRQRFLDGNRGARQRGPNKLQRAKQAEIERYRAEGRALIGRLTEREFRVTGLALYAGEGSKRDGNVLFANSDPRMILFFVTWLRHFFDVDEQRLRVRLYLHQGLDLDRAVRFWSELTAIPLSQFGKPYRAVPDAGIRNTKHEMGCPGVGISSSPIHRQVMGQIEALLSSEALAGLLGAQQRSDPLPG